MGIRVHADRELCIGSENCLHFAPETFDTDSTGKVVVLEGSTTSADQVRTAVAACPVGALRVEDNGEATDHV